jgi:hypothetical protein
MIDKYGLKSNCEKKLILKLTFEFCRFYKTLHGTTYESEYWKHTNQASPLIFLNS